MQSINQKFVSVNNIKISYCSYGDPANTTILFVHGYPLDQTMWETQVAYLKDEFHIITFDIRGFGQTESGDEEYSLPLFADDISQLMQTLKISKAVLCGFSMGGYIALNACLAYPNLFSGLILHDTQCSADTDAAREQRMQSIDFIQQNGVKAYAGPFIKKMITAASLDNSELVNYLDTTINLQTPEQLSRILKALADRKETCSRLSEIKIPVLIIRGKEDAIIGEDKAEYLKSHIEKSTNITLNDAGHLSNMEKPAEFNAAVYSFMQGIK